jgi:hypothetical protein
MVQTQQAYEFAKQNNLPYFEVSAKLGQGVESMFIELVGLMYMAEMAEQLKDSVPMSYRVNSFMLAARGGQADLPHPVSSDISSSNCC